MPSTKSKLASFDRAPKTKQSILGQLELEISSGEADLRFPGTAFLVFDSKKRICEHDRAAVSILGMPCRKRPSLSHCKSIDKEQGKRLQDVLDGILKDGSSKNEQFFRLEANLAGSSCAYCLTLSVQETINGDRQVACRMESLAQQQPRHSEHPEEQTLHDSAITLWSMDSAEREFNYLPPLSTEAPGAYSENAPLSEWLANVCNNDRDEFEKGINDLLNGQSDDFQFRYRLQGNNGKERWISTIARRDSPTAEANGRRSIVGLHKEETDRTKPVDDLRLFTYLAEKVQLAILATDAQGRVNWCNQAFTEISGYSLKEINAKIPEEFLYGTLTDQETIERMRDRMKRGKAFHAELLNYKKNGAPYWTRLDANPLFDEEGSLVRYISFLTDISESKNAQSAILRSEVKFRSLFDNSMDALLLVSPRDGAIIEANQAATEFLEADRLVGRRLDDIFPESNVFRIDQLTEMVSEAGGNQRASGEFVRADGRRQPVEMTVNRIPIGESIALFVTLRDISEKRLLEEQLRHAQRMEAVGRLSGGIAHDFNNLLAGLRGFSELLNNSKELSERDRVYSMEVLKITDRASKLTSRLLSFSRGKSDRPIVTNLNDIVGNLIPMLSRILKKDIQFTSRLDPSTGNVKVDPNQIEQVVMNLVVNGQEAIASTEGIVDLYTGSEMLNGSEIFVTGKPKAGPYSTVTVRDNGQGISPKVMEKVFEPFFTTKKGAGTGLGLSIVYGIIQSNGGHIAVQSEEGEGTQFTFYFPVVAGKIQATETPDHEISKPHEPLANNQPKTILLAEDQEQVREILELGLTQCGYELLIACDGTSAIELARSYEGEIDLLLTDSIMPKAPGSQVIKETRKSYPDIKVIMMSGLPQNDSDDAEPLEIDAYVNKPFSIGNLIQQIETILQEKRSSGR